MWEAQRSSPLHNAEIAINSEPPSEPRRAHAPVTEKADCDQQAQERGTYDNTGSQLPQPRPETVNHLPGPQCPL